jgi:hypothetical protein
MLLRGDLVRYAGNYENGDPIGMVLCRINKKSYLIPEYKVLWDHGDEHAAFEDHIEKVNVEIVKDPNTNEHIKNLIWAILKERVYLQTELLYKKSIPDTLTNMMHLEYTAICETL